MSLQKVRRHSKEAALEDRGGGVPPVPKTLVASLQRSLSFGKRPAGRKSPAAAPAAASAGTPAASSASCAAASAGTPAASSAYCAAASAGTPAASSAYCAAASAGTPAAPSPAASSSTAEQTPVPRPVATASLACDDDDDERPIEFNERGVPLLTSLPEILGELESTVPAERTQGATHLARLVDGSAGDQACLLGDYMREAGAVELLVALLGDERPATVQLVLMALGNACSDAFDLAAAETRARLRGSGVLRLLLPLLGSADGTVQLYAAAALQNVCKDLELALDALDLGAAARLDALCAAPAARGGREMLGHFAAGALLNMHAALGALGAPPAPGGATPRAPWRRGSRRAAAALQLSHELSDETREAIARRQQHHARSRQKRWRRRPKGAAAPAAGDAEPPPTDARGSAGTRRDASPPQPAAPPPEEGGALQTRLPFVDLAQVRGGDGGKQREQREGRGEASPPGSPKSTSSKTSWASYFTAMTSTSVGSYKSACTAAEEQV